jgi:hypothetical protein
MGGSSPFLLVFGRGGVERFVAYPVLLWIIGFGDYLMGASSTNAGQRKTAMPCGVLCD